MIDLRAWIRRICGWIVVADLLCCFLGGCAGGGDGAGGQGEAHADGRVDGPLTSGMLGGGVLRGVEMQAKVEVGTPYLIVISVLGKPYADERVAKKESETVVGRSVIYLMEDIGGEPFRPEWHKHLWLWFDAGDRLAEWKEENRLNR